MQTQAPEEVDARLAALAGNTRETKPASELERNLLRLRLIAEAQSRGATWKQIAAVLGVPDGNGKMAKASVKRLARITQRELLAQQIGQAG